MKSVKIERLQWIEQNPKEIDPMSCSLCFITLHFKLTKRTNNEKKKEEYLEKDTGGRSNKYRCRSIDESVKAEGNGQEISIHKSKAL